MHGCINFNYMLRGSMSIFVQVMFIFVHSTRYNKVLLQLVCVLQVRQIWASNSPAYWGIYASHGLNELSTSNNILNYNLY